MMKRPFLQKSLQSKNANFPISKRIYTSSCSSAYGFCIASIIWILSCANGLTMQGFFTIKACICRGLELVEKAKVKARQYQQHGLLLELLEFEKIIEAQFSNRRTDYRTDELMRESVIVSQVVSRMHLFSKLSTSTARTLFESGLCQK